MGIGEITPIFESGTDEKTMKKTLLIIVCVLLSTAAVSFGGAEPLANDGKSGLYARSIEQVLRLDAEEVDLATAVLIISERWNDNVYGRRYISKIDDMALEIRSRLEAKRLKANYKAIAVINKYLFDELGFESVPEANNPNDLFLHSVMDRKRGYCLSLSVLYLSLGERLGLPLYGVVAPGHFFVRYDDGQIRFNIEATSKGGNATDEYYINKFKVPQGDNDNIYMVNLNKIQTLGCFFNNLGNSYSDIGNTESALLALERAVQINPSLAESRINLGNVYLNTGRIKDAIYEYQTALKINPNDAKAHNNLGNAYTKKDWLNDAISQYSRALQLDQNFTDAYKNLANAYCKREMFGLAVTQLKQAIILEPKNALLYSQLGNVYSQADDCERAILQYKNALKIDSNLAEANYGMAVCYNKLGLVDDEIRAYKKALASEPDMVAALMNLGNAYFGRQKYDAAIEQYKKAIRIKPDNGTIHYNLGAAYFNKTDYELAWEHIKIAEQLGAEIAEDLLDAIEDKL